MNRKFVLWSVLLGSSIGCGRGANSLPGAYVLDAGDLESRTAQQMAEQLAWLRDQRAQAQSVAKMPLEEDPPKGIDPEVAQKLAEMDQEIARVEREQQESIRDLHAQLADTRVEWEFLADGTFTWNGRKGETTASGGGTWELAGDRLTITTTLENGLRVDAPRSVTGSYADGAIVIEVSDRPVPVRLRRK